MVHGVVTISSDEIRGVRIIVLKSFLIHIHIYAFQGTIYM